MVHDLLGDGSVGLLHDSVDALGCLDGIWLLVDPFEFFKGAALGLDTEELLAEFSLFLFRYLYIRCRKIG